MKFMMGNRKMKRVCALFMLICTFLFVACSRDNVDDYESEGKTESYGNRDNTFLENYVYMPRQVNFPDPAYPLQGATAFGEMIYYWYVNSAPDIVIVSMMADGSEKQETRIPAQGLAVDVGGVQITEDGFYNIVRNEFHENYGNIVIYGIYDQHGAEVYSRDISDIVTPNRASVLLEQAVFTEDGNLALTVWGDRGNELYLFKSEGASPSPLSLGNSQVGFHSIVKLRDGRVMALHRDGDRNYLQEIDFAAGDWGEVTPLLIRNARKLLPAMDDQPFDLLVDDGSYLYGYTFETETQTPLISWIEAGISTVHSYYIGQLADERIFLLNIVSTPSEDSFNYDIEFYVLTRIDRADIMSERTVLTLGLLGSMLVFEELLQEVMAFNRENPHYQIELINYLDEADGDWDAAELRRSTDMITGNAPDIILYRLFREDNPDLMVDLYTFIDSDPELDRTDFFPNVLRAQESPAGTLPFIGNTFSIRTMITMRDTAEKLTPLTFDSIIRQLEESNVSHVFGEMVTRDMFLSDSLHYSGNYFIDWDNNRANLDSEEFISLLEIAARLPSWEEIHEQFSEDYGSADYIFLEYERLHSGEQLLYPFSLQSLRIFHETRAFFGDIVAVGMPTGTGGQHVINSAHTSVGIYAGSQNQDAAWSFVRRLLMFNSVIHLDLPLRIDRYEALVAEMMRPNIVNGEEQPRQAWHFPIPDLYAMTEEEAAMIREIIDTASLRMQYDHTIMDIIREGSDDFFAGSRTAVDTARIMQNRVQTVLNERG